MSIVENKEDIENSSSDIFKLEWYYIDAQEKQPKGPISIRDIDVFMRTNTIDSNTYVWKEEQSDWKKIYQIEELRDIASTTHTEIQESLIKNKIQSAFSLLNNQKVENSSLDNYYFGADGFWHVYNPTTKTWSQQETKPFSSKSAVCEFEEEVDNSMNIETKISNKTSLEVKTISEVSFESIEMNKLNEIEVRIETSTNELLNTKRKRSDEEIHVENNVKEVLKTDKDLQKIEKKKQKTHKKKEKKKQQWYMPKVNSNVYVNGLPKEITEGEVISYFSRCGFIRKDQRTGESKIKMYKDQNGQNKGDALISFLREESVTMAVELLNDTEIRPGCRIHVEKAKFEQKGDYKIRETYKIDYLQRYKNKTEYDRMLGWNEEDDEKGLRIVILKNMFQPNEFFEDEGLRQDLELDIIEESETNFGQVERFMIFEENPEGIIKIKFKTPLSAEKCIEGLNKRYYNGKSIEAFYWDGKTDYSKFKEDVPTQDKRIEEFGQWLEK